MAENYFKSFVSFYFTMGINRTLDKMKCQKKIELFNSVYNVGIAILYHKVLHFISTSDEIFYINNSFIYQRLA